MEPIPDPLVPGAAPLWNVDPATCMEVPDGHFVFNYPAMSRMHCKTNILTMPTMTALRAHWVSNGQIVEDFEIKTGGGFIDEDGNRQRWPSVFTDLNKIAPNWTTRANSAEWAECSAFFQERLLNPQEGDPPSEEVPQAYNQCCINPSFVLWRLRHGGRLIPVTTENSHLGESYHSPAAIPGYRSHWRVEYTEMEKEWVNLSRKVCRRGALMWRKAGTGELIPVAEIGTYVGDTCCWHAAFGSPCYGPHPTHDIGEQPYRTTGLTPSKRKGGKPSGGGRGGRAMAKRGRKKGGGGAKGKGATAVAST